MTRIYTEVEFDLSDVCDYELIEEIESRMDDKSFIKQLQELTSINLYDDAIIFNGEHNVVNNLNFRSKLEEFLEQNKHNNY